MTPRALTDDIWLKIQKTMASKSCYDIQNIREIMEAILWKSDPF